MSCRKQDSIVTCLHYGILENAILFPVIDHTLSSLCSAQAGSWMDEISLVKAPLN